MLETSNLNMKYQENEEKWEANNQKKKKKKIQNLVVLLQGTVQREISYYNK